MWENRPTPVIYSSPYREIPLDCSGSVNLNRILAGVYRQMDGLHINIGSNIITCDPSPSPLDDTPNIYECMLANSTVEVGDDDLLRINQIVFLHDGTTDTPLISIDISELL